MSDTGDFISIVSALWPGFTSFAGLPDPYQPDVTILSEILATKNAIPAGRSALVAALAAWSAPPNARPSSAPFAVAVAINNLLSLSLEVARLVHNAVDKLPAAQDYDVYEGALSSLASRNAELVGRLSAVGIVAQSSALPPASLTSARLQHTDAIAADALTLATLYVVGAPALVVRCQKYLITKIGFYSSSLVADGGMDFLRRVAADFRLPTIPIVKGNQDLTITPGGELPYWTLKGSPFSSPGTQPPLTHESHSEDVYDPHQERAPDASDDTDSESLLEWARRRAGEEEWQRYLKTRSSDEAVGPRSSIDRSRDREGADAAFEEFVSGLGGEAKSALGSHATQEFEILNDSLQRFAATGHFSASQFGAVAKAMGANTLKSVGSQAAAKGGMEVADGIASLAKGSGDAAGHHFAAAGAFFALAAGAGLAGGAMTGAPAAATKKNDAPQPSGSQKSSGGGRKVVQQITVLGSPANGDVSGVTSKLKMLAH